LAENRNRLPDAVFCVTDWVALGVIRTLQLRGFKVPDDVAVSGFDDIPYGRAATPTLTTISPDRTAIARLAVESLLAQLDDPTYEPVEQEAPFTLIIRESTAGVSTVPL
jgi:DNA-binding LacI/PurR family transcriptional regulator